MPHRQGINPKLRKTREDLLNWEGKRETEGRYNVAVVRIAQWKQNQPPTLLPDHLPQAKPFSPFLRHTREYSGTVVIWLRDEAKICSEVRGLGKCPPLLAANKLAGWLFWFYTGVARSRGKTVSFLWKGKVVFAVAPCLKSCRLRSFEQSTSTSTARDRNAWSSTPIIKGVRILKPALKPFFKGVEF